MIEKDKKWIKDYWSLQIFECDIKLSPNIKVGDEILISPPVKNLVSKALITEIQHFTNYSHIKFKAKEIDTDQFFFYDPSNSYQRKKP